MLFVAISAVVSVGLAVLSLISNRKLANRGFGHRQLTSALSWIALALTASLVVVAIIRIQIAESQPPLWFWLAVAIAGANLIALLARLIIAIGQVHRKKRSPTTRLIVLGFLTGCAATLLAAWIPLSPWI